MADGQPTEGAIPTYATAFLHYALDLPMHPIIAGTLLLIVVLDAGVLSAGLLRGATS